MKITIITSNQLRHNYFVNNLKKNFDKVYIIQEKKFKNFSFSDNANDNFIKKYIEKSTKAENEIFKITSQSGSNNFKLKLLKYGEINQLDFLEINDFLKSDIYIVYGCSFLKGKIANHLIKNNAINIHMGIAPYYRGASCNFWALYDDNPHLVGATIHRLSYGLDDGPILYHALTNIKNNPYEYTMMSVKSAFTSIIEKIRNRSIFNIKAVEQSKTKQIRYSRKKDLDKFILNNYFNKKIDLNKKKFDENLLIKPYFLND